MEQNANFALDVSKRGYVLETGRVVLSDESSSLRDEPRGPEGLPRHMTVFAIIGAKSLLLLYLWLGSVIVCSYLSDRKGYGDGSRAGDGPAAVDHRRHHLARGSPKGRFHMEAGGDVRATALRGPR